MYLLWCSLFVFVVAFQHEEVGSMLHHLRVYGIESAAAER